MKIITFYFRFLIIYLTLISINPQSDCGFGQFSISTGICMECLYSCPKCVKLIEKCQRCSQGLKMNSVTKQCQTCGLGEKYCQQSKFQCQNFYKINNNKCQPVCQVKNCRKCISATSTVCQSCSDNYTLQPDKRICVESKRILQEDIMDKRTDSDNLTNLQNNDKNISNQTSFPVVDNFENVKDFFPNPTVSPVVSLSNNDEVLDMQASQNMNINSTQPIEILNKSISKNSSLSFPDINPPTINQTTQSQNRSTIQTIIQPISKPLTQVQQQPIIPLQTINNTNQITSPTNSSTLTINTTIGPVINENVNEIIIGGLISNLSGLQPIENITTNNNNTNNNNIKTNTNITSDIEINQSIITNISTNISTNNLLLPKILTNTSSVSTEKEIANHTLNIMPSTTHNTDINETINNNIMVSCKIGEILLHNKCQSCTPPCASCINFNYQCLQCAQGYRKIGWKCIRIETVKFNIYLNTKLTQSGLEESIYGIRKQILQKIMNMKQQQNQRSIITLEDVKLKSQLQIVGYVDCQQQNCSLQHLQKRISNYLQSTKKLNNMTITNFKLSQNFNGTDKNQLTRTFTKQIGPNGQTIQPTLPRQNNNFVAIIVPIVLGICVLGLLIGCFVYYSKKNKKYCFKQKQLQTVGFVQNQNQMGGNYDSDRKLTKNVKTGSQVELDQIPNYVNQKQVHADEKMQQLSHLDSDF